MGEEICTVCKDDDNTNNNDGDLSARYYMKNQNINFNSGIEPQKINSNFMNKNNKNKNNFGNNEINNLNENNNILYDNPLCNISLNESMNLGNCYIGTSNNNAKLKAYKPDVSLRTLISKNKITLDSTNNNNSTYKFNESPLNKRINLTTKNKNKNYIDYNDFFEKKVKIPNLNNNSLQKNKETPNNHFICEK